MAAEQANFGLFAWKKKKEENEAAFANACNDMKSAMDNMHINVSSANLSRGSDDETADVLGSGPQTPLLNNKPLSHSVAEIILKEIKTLQKENPLNTQFLTYVLHTTTAYIKNPNDATTLGNYKQMTTQVAAKYGNYSKLFVGLLGLPAAIVIGGMIGTIFLCAAFPALTPFLVTGICMALLAGTVASTVPANKAHTIATGWQGLKTTFSR